MKRTKKQKIKANLQRVNTQLGYKFEGAYNQNVKKKSAVNMEKSNTLGSIKKDLYKSLIIASLILISLVVVYWFS